MGMEAHLADAPERLDDPALDRLRAVARLMDSAFRVPGTTRRFGIDPFLALVPGGEVVSTGVSLYVVLEAANLGVSYLTILRMLANVGINSVGSAVPVLGPVFAGIFKSNERNLTLLVEKLWDEAERRERESAEAVEIEIE
jgi:hypothetical protein